MHLLSSIKFKLKRIKQMLMRAKVVCWFHYLKKLLMFFLEIFIILIFTEGDNFFAYLKGENSRRFIFVLYI
jgi:hypothetical protein